MLEVLELGKPSYNTRHPLLQYWAAPPEVAVDLECVGEEGWEGGLSHPFSLAVKSRDYSLAVYQTDN